MKTPIEHAMSRFADSGESFIHIHRYWDALFREYWGVRLCSTQSKTSRGDTIASAINNALDDAEEQATNGAGGEL